MIAASIWSLLIPSIDMSSELNIQKWIPPTIGIFFSFIILLMIDKITKKLENKTNNNVNDKKMMVFVVTLHNIPEGLAVGVALGGAFFGNSTISFISAFMLTLGIAIQNLPEGAIISLPLAYSGKSKGKSFFIGVLSGLVEPIAGVIAFFVTGLVSSILPYVLAFSAGAMIFVVIRELIPESQEEGFENISTLGFFCGFLIMMILDISFG